MRILCMLVVILLTTMVSFAQQNEKAKKNTENVQADKTKTLPSNQDSKLLKLKAKNPLLSEEQLKKQIVNESQQKSASERSKKEMMVKEEEAREQETILKLEAKSKEAAANTPVEESFSTVTLKEIQYTIYTSQNEYRVRITTDNGKEIADQFLGEISVMPKGQAEELAKIAAQLIENANENYKITSAQLDQLIKTGRNIKPGQTINSGITNRSQSTLADFTFSNVATITIPGTGTGATTGAPASPYPSTIVVAGVPLGAVVKSITINGFAHTFPDDVDVLVQSPLGTNVILMSDAGGGTDATGQNYTYADAAAAMADAAVNGTGTYRPTNFGTPDAFPAPGPGSVSQATPSLSNFGLVDHNGVWSLYITDDAAIDAGSITSWSITFTTDCLPVNITSTLNPAVCPGANASFTVNSIANALSYNWQEDRGSGYSYLTNGGVYSGVNTPTLTLTGVTAGMSGYKYRVVVTCAGGGLPTISNEGTLTVLPMPSTGPTVVPTSATICAGQSTLITVPGGATTSFSNPNSITIPSSGNGTPYPSTIAVSGLPVGTTVKSITLNGMNHTWSDDIDIVLVSPGGTSVILMSDVGGSGDLVNTTYTFDDAAASVMTGAPVPAGTWRPTNLGTPDNFPAPGPGSLTQATPAISSFGAGSHNGNWSLYVVDDVGGDLGNISGGWSITFQLPISTAAFSPVTGLYTNAGLTTPYVAGTQVTQVYAAPTSTTVYAATSVLGTCPSPPTNVTITVNPTPIAPIIVPSSANVCPDQIQSLTVAGGSTATFNYTGTPIAISTGPAGPATPYPANITVSGLPIYGINVKSVTLNGFSHTWTSDVDIVLQSPSGTYVVLMSDVGGTAITNNATYTFDDAAATTMVGAPVPSGTWRPTNSGATDVFPAPVGSLTQATPLISNFGTGNHNGVWRLFVADDAGADGGSITSWSITFDVVAPATAVFSPVANLFTDAGATVAYTGTAESVVYFKSATPGLTNYSVTSSTGSCTSAVRTVPVTVYAPTAITSHPASASVCVGGTRTFTVVAAGGNLTYQWQVNDGSGFVNLSNNATYSGATTATLTITGATAGMNNYQYRVIVSGQCTPTSVTSNAAILTVNALPTITVGPSDVCGPVLLTASGANTYSWSPAAGLSATTGASVTANPVVNTLYTVTGTNTATGCSNTATANVIFTPAAPIVSPSAVTICSTAPTATPLTITSSMFPPSTASAASGTISVLVPDNNTTTTSLPLAGIPAGANITNVTVRLNNINMTWDGDLIINIRAPNGNVLNLINEQGGSGDNFVNTVFSSTAVTSITTASPPFTGTFLPAGVLAVGGGVASNVANFAGLIAGGGLNGNWILSLTDVATGDQATVTSWGLSISYTTSPDPGVWSPLTGLFNDAAMTSAYTGTSQNVVYAKPAVTTTYNVTVTNSSPGAGSDLSFNGNAITINSVGNGTPYPSTLTASGLANASVKSVTINNFAHTWAGDVDIVLVSPSGTPVVLMSDIADDNATSGQTRTYTFSDAAAGGLSAASPLSPSGTYKPTNFAVDPDIFPAPGPGDLSSQSSPALSSFGVGNQNGVWSLYVVDDIGGDAGSIGSWSITFNIPPGIVNCTSPPRSVTVTVDNPVVFTTQPANRTACQNSNASFTVAATGTITTIQWQVSVGGGPFTNIAGANAATLNVLNVQPSMTGNKYRAIISNVGCGSFTSGEATLTVNPKPTVSLSLIPAGQTQLRPGMLTTVTVNSSPAGASYVWFVNGVAQPSISGSSYVVDAYHLGTYTVRVTDVNGCDSITTGVTFTAIPTSNLYIYPNPTTGAYYITYYTQNPMPITINIIDMKGRRIVQRQESSTAPYTRFDFTSEKLAAGVYVIEFRNAEERLLATGRLVVTR